MFMSKLKQSTAFWKYVLIFSGFKVESCFLKIFEFLLNFNSSLPYFHLSFFCDLQPEGVLHAALSFQENKKVIISEISLGLADCLCSDALPVGACCWVGPGRCWLPHCHGQNCCRQLASFGSGLGRLSVKARVPVSALVPSCVLCHQPVAS